MARIKDFLIGVEELVYEAMEFGFTDTEGVYAYVYMYEPRVDKHTIEAILESMADPRERYELEP